MQNSINEKKNNDTMGIKDSDSLFTDEFNESIEYLQQLSQERKKNIDNQIKKDNLERKTVKNYSSIYASPSINQTNINVDLPDELKPTTNNFLSQPYLINTNNANNANNAINSINNIPIKINTALQEPINVTSSIINNSNNINSSNNNNNNTITLVKEDVPYGILKGGTKPTYRVWNKTHKNNNNKGNFYINNNAIVNNANKNTSAREDRLNQLKDKFREKSIVNNIPNVVSNIAQPVIALETNNYIQTNSTTANNANNANNINPNLNNINPNPYVTSNKLKKTTKKTITKKYTLGKSKIKRRVGILIKNRETRKKVIMAHRDLKHQPIHEIKTYLNEHNLLKIGSKAPNDVIRKLYENSKLSGDVYNLNNDTLLYNLVKSDNN